MKLKGGDFVVAVRGSRWISYPPLPPHEDEMFHRMKSKGCLNRRRELHRTLSGEKRRAPDAKVENLLASMSLFRRSLLGLPN